MATSLIEIGQKVCRERRPPERGIIGGAGRRNRTGAALVAAAAMLNVYLNDEDVRVLDGLETSSSDSDTVVILPAMAGGAAPAEPPFAGP